MRLRAINIYPVKSLRAIAVESAKVHPRGLEHDRRWLVVDEDGIFRTQRSQAQMATISTSFEDGQLVLSQNEDFIVVPPAKPPLQNVTVWNRTVEAVDCGDDVAKWLTEKLDAPSRLVHMRCEALNDNRTGENEHVSFADGFPLLLANDASLKDLNAKLDEPVGMERFRANLIVEGASAWAEDEWKTLQIGAVRFRNAKPCGRCIVTTTDQTTGERRGPEPLQTLATFRLREQRIDFAVNLVPETLGMIRVGDQLTLIE